MAKLIVEVPDEICQEVKTEYNGSDVAYCAVKFGTIIPEALEPLIVKLIKDAKEE